MKKVHKKCVHGRRSGRCIDCGGSQFCEHGKRKDACKECKGSQICEHGRQRSSCIECDGGNICKCKKQRSSCRKCDPLGWAKRCLYSSEKTARQRGYVPPKITPEEFVFLANKTKRCIACDGKLDWERKYG